PVKAVANGTVALVYNGGTGCVWWAYGILVKHTLPDGTAVYSQYMHVDPNVSKGQQVGRGDVIAHTHNLGNPQCSPNHLHFAVWIGGDAYTTQTERGRLPQIPCGGESAFPGHFVDPTQFIASHGGGGGGGGGGGPNVCAPYACGQTQYWTCGGGGNLHECAADGNPIQTTCSTGCHSTGTCTDDICNDGSGGNCSSGNGLYCGGDTVSGDPNNLYRCTNGAISFVQNCPAGCQWMPPG